MSLLNDDVLSEKGYIQSAFWDEVYSSRNINNSISIGRTLDYAIEKTKINIIDHLSLDDKKCMESISLLESYVNDLKSLGVTSSPYTDFIYQLTESLSDYSTINDNVTNNKNKVIDDKFKSYYTDETKILYAMLKNGLIDSNEVQSLLDNQNFEIRTAADSLIARCCRGESPSNGSSGIHKPSLLGLKDFGTDSSKILECVESFITEGVDLFPNSSSEICKTIFAGKDFDNQVLYSQDNYISNLANYGIISATSKYIENSFNVDTETGIYILSSLLDKLKEFINKFDMPICLMMYMATAMVLNKKIKESDRLDDISMSYSIKKELANAFSLYNKIDSDKNQISKMIRIPQELKDFVVNANLDECDVPFCEDDDIISDIETALNDILSSIEEIEETMEYYGIRNDDSKEVDLQVSLESTGISSQEVEHSGSKIRDIKETYLGKVEEVATKFHSDLNQSLLEGNFENAAKQIAFEIALLEQTNDNHMSSVPLATVERDITTYNEMINKSSSGISSYLESARSEVIKTLSQ